MKQKLMNGIFVALFLLLSLTTVVGMALHGPSAPAANEQLQQTPALKNKDGSLNTSYLSDFAQWVNDRFYLRQELVTLHNRLKAQLLRTSGAESVIAGKDGWLYYTPTLPDYTGTELMNARELFAAANNLALMAEYCAGQDTDFVFVITPNKNSLYADAMPDYGVQAETSNAQMLLQALDARNVKTVDLFDAFSAQSETLYFAHDSHWNSRGAALGADCINAAFGIESHYFTADFSQSQPHQGDLYAMLYPALTDPEQDPVCGAELSYSFSGAGTKPDSITIETTGAGQGHLLAYRDSFGNLLFPYLADSAATARFSRSTAYDLTRQADRVLIQLVERNLRYLVTYAPIMPSPQRTLTLPQETAGNAVCESTQKNAPKGTFKLTGVLPAPADDASPVYVVCGGTAYEAFILEDGFCAYVPDTAQPEYLVFTAEGALKAYTL